MGWEYRKIDLNALGGGHDEVGVLTEAGKNGWELVIILANNVAYMKRQCADVGARMRFEEQGGDKAPADAVRPKYRDPATGNTWSGRGRMARWLKDKLDAGENIEKYHV